MDERPPDPSPRSASKTRKPSSRQTLIAVAPWRSEPNWIVSSRELAHTRTNATSQPAHRPATFAVLQATMPMPATAASQGTTSHTCRWNGSQCVARSNQSVEYQGWYPSTVDAPLGACGKSSAMTPDDEMSAFA